MKYILDENRKPVKENDLFKWGEWMQTADRHVAKTKADDDVEVSTVFLGLDHNFWGEGPPILFETMIFGGEHDGWMDRYATWEEAELGHLAAVRMVGIVLIGLEVITERNND